MVDSSAASDHDKECNHIRDDAASNHIQAAKVVVTPVNALLYDGGLQVELHPGRNGGSNQADNGDQIGRIRAEGRYKRLLQREIPIRFRQESGDRVSKVNQRSNDEDAFYRLIAAAHDQRPNQRRADRNHDIFADAEDAHAGSQTRKLRNNVAEIRKPQDDHGEKRGA